MLRLLNFNALPCNQMAKCDSFMNHTSLYKTLCSLPQVVLRALPAAPISKSCFARSLDLHLALPPPGGGPEAMAPTHVAMLLGILEIHSPFGRLCKRKHLGFKLSPCRSRFAVPSFRLPSGALDREGSGTGAGRVGRAECWSHRNCNVHV